MGQLCPTCGIYFAGVTALVKISDLRVKDVVNLADGRRIGLIGDFELDLESGRVTAIVVPGPGRVLGFFGRERDLVIPWRQVKRIGIDVILVELDTPGAGVEVPPPG